jgi:hypothetical protein
MMRALGLLLLVLAVGLASVGGYFLWAARDVLIPLSTSLPLSTTVTDLLLPLENSVVSLRQEKQQQQPARTARARRPTSPRQSRPNRKALPRRPARKLLPANQTKLRSQRSRGSVERAAFLMIARAAGARQKPMCLLLGVTILIPRVALIPEPATFSAGGPARAANSPRSKTIARRSSSCRKATSCLMVPAP